MFLLFYFVSTTALSAIVLYLVMALNDQYTYPYRFSLEFRVCLVVASWLIGSFLAESFQSFPVLAGALIGTVLRYTETDQK